MGQLFENKVCNQTTIVNCRTLTADLINTAQIWWTSGLRVVKTLIFLWSIYNELIFCFKYSSFEFDLFIELNYAVKDN